MVTQPLKHLMHKLWFERTIPEKYKYLLNGKAEIIGAGNETPDNPLVALPQAEGIIASSYIKYDGAFMDQAPKLKVISRTGIGINNIVVADATERNIAICNTPDGPTISTAEHAVGLMFAVAKLVKQNDRALRQGVDVMYFSQHNAIELFQKTLGLIGLGRIGGHVAKIAQGIGMQVIAYDPFVSAEKAQALGVALQPSVADVLKAADVVSVHVPLMPETEHIIDADALAMMKPGAILINAARGGLVDEDALLAALESGHLHGAGLDVFAIEPAKPDHPLLHREDVVATPHIASATFDGKDRLWEGAIRHAIEVLDGVKPAGLVNQAVWST